LQCVKPARPLHRDLRIALSGVFDRAIERVMRRDVLVILILIRRIDAQEIMIVRDLMHQDIVDESAMLIEQPGILRLSDD